MSKTKTTEMFKNEVKELVGKDYTVLGNYINSSTHVEFIHNVCGFEYKVTPNTFLSGGRRCPKCNGGIKLTNDEFLIKFNEQEKYEEYEILEQYKSASTKLKMLHKNCGNIFSMRPTNFYANDRCPFCSRNKKIESKDFEKEVLRRTNGRYEVLEEYVNNKTKIKMKHTKCGTIDYYYPKDFLYKGVKCKKCGRSIGEETISRILEENNISFEYQYKINGCFNKKVLEFDFKIDLEEDSFLLIEYNGELHYKPWKDEEKHLKHLMEQQKRDLIKKTFCKENNIELIVISYKEKNDIEEIILKIINR